jgi:hypothetical protein
VALPSPDEELGIGQQADAVLAVGQGDEAVGVAVPPLDRNRDIT